jgi:preprotein translocase subunit SecY
MVQELIAMVTGQSNAMGYVLGVAEVILSIALTIAVIGLIVWFTNSERRIPIQYAKRVVGRKMYGGQTSNLPLKMNMAGVMPVIFASSIVSIPATIAGFTGGGFSTWVSKWFSYTSPAYIILFIILIFLFSYFYIMISFNPVEVANNIRSNGGSVPGIRPGKPTSDYIKKILNRITTMGAVFLAVIAGVPLIVSAFASGFSSAAFGGTSLLIVVGVALETVRDLEAQLAMRNYKGFLD